MFTMDSSLTAEIDYRHQRVREVWTPRRTRLRALARTRRLHAGPRPGVVGTVAAAR